MQGKEILRYPQFEIYSDDETWGLNCSKEGGSRRRMGGEWREMQV
jgi:hypothetical protein